MPTLIYSYMSDKSSVRRLYFMDMILVQTGDKGIRESLRRAMRASPKSRAMIAEELSERVGRDISVESLNKWASEVESSRRLPADCILPLSQILSDDSLQRLMLTEHMKRCLRLGEWLLSSRWVIQELQVKLPRGKAARDTEEFRESGRRAGRTANRP